MSDFDLKLNFDKRNGYEFRTLIMTVKGLGVNCLILNEVEDSVALTIATPYTELRVPKCLLLRA
jgi:hypothetical protein